MQADLRVVGLGLCVYDLTLLVDRAPAPDTKVDALDVWHGGGGPVPNTLVALARLGVPCAFVGTVGDDLWGHALRADFVQAGVDISCLSLSPGRATPVASLQVDARTGERIAVLGGDPALAPPSIPEGLIERAQLVHFDARHPASCREALTRAHGSGVAVSMDAGSPRGEGLEFNDVVDHLVVAERYAHFATGQSRVEDMLTKLWRPAHQSVAITRGPLGSVGRDRAHEFVACERFEVEVVDTTGAGDVYHAGFLLGVLEGWDLPRRMEFASAAAALACTRLGARGCLPSRSEVAALLAARKVPTV